MTLRFMVNESGQPERVLTAEQWAALALLASDEEQEE